MGIVAPHKANSVDLSKPAPWRVNNLSNGQYRMTQMQLAMMFLALAVVLSLTLVVLCLAFGKAVWDGFRRSIWLGCSGFFILFYCAGVVCQNLRF